jgi:hypothetical protein
MEEIDRRINGNDIERYNKKDETNQWMFLLFLS